MYDWTKIGRNFSGRDTEGAWPHFKTELCSTSHQPIIPYLNALFNLNPVARSMETMRLLSLLSLASATHHSEFLVR